MREGSPWTHPRAAHESPGVGPHLGRHCRDLLHLLPKWWTTLTVPSGHSPARPLVSGAKRSARTTWGPSSSGVMSSVLKPRRESPSTVSRGPVISTPYGRFSERAEVASQQDGALLKRLIGGMESGAVRHHALTVGAYHQEGCRTTLSACNCVENTTGIPSSPATLNPHRRFARNGSSSRP